MRLLLTVVFLSCVAPVRLAAREDVSSFKRSIDKVEALTLDGEYRRAIAKLNKLLASRRLSEKERAETLTLLGAAEIKLGRPKDALAALRRVKGLKPEKFHLIEGEASLALGKNEDAIRSASHYDKNNSKGTLRRVKALWIKARAFFNMKSYLKCLGVCGAIAEANPFAEVQLSERNENQRMELADLKAKAEKMGEDAREALDVILYGRDFAWYRKARRSDFKGDYEKAMEFYANIQSGTLKKAADCYIARCLALLGKSRDALKASRRFVDRDPHGLYVGEILWRTATLTYSEFSSKRDPKPALKIVAQLGEWLENVEKNQAFDIALEEINDNLKKDVIDKTPKRFLEKNSCGNLIPTKRYPADIINRLTSPWYLDRLKFRAKLLHAFLLGEDDMKTEAAALYRKTGKSGAGKLVADTGSVPLLLKSLALGSYPIPLECLKKVSSKNINRIALANFLYCSDDKTAAAILADSVARSEKRVRPADLAASLLLKAYCLIDSRKWKDALKLLKKLATSRKLAKLPSRIPALYLRACLLSKNKPKKAYPLFQIVAKSKNRPFAPMALLAQALCAANHENKKLAVATCGVLKRKFPKSKYAAAAMTLRRAIKNCETGRFAKPVDAPTGKAFVHRRTIVVPGATPWDVSTSSLDAGDIIIYNLKFVGNGPCRVVTSVNVDLTRHEPQPPRKKGDRLIFLRAPILFVEKLTCDFEQLR